MVTRALTAATIVALSIGSWQVLPGHQLDADAGYTIRGRVVDPHGLRPQEAVLMLGSQRDDDGGFDSFPVAVARDGSFLTGRVRPGRYVLEVVRTPHSTAKPATVVGFTVVAVEAADVSGVTVVIRRDTAITGRFRMESDDPNPVWPTQIVVNAFLAFDGAPLQNGTVAHGAPAGRFLLQNAFGPRVLRAGYGLAPGHSWWPSRVVLDGVDITNVPTDFSGHDGANLEVWFTRHPPRISGVVTSLPGDPVAGAWVLAWSAEQKRWQPWSTTSHVLRTRDDGTYGIVTLPGRYLVQTLPPAALSSRGEVTAHFARLASGATPIELGARETKHVVLRTGEPPPRR